MTASIDVRLDAIELDVSIQCRAHIDTAVVNEYAEAMTDGATFPPIMLFAADGKHYIGDGWHRVMASKQIGALGIPATVEPGGRAAALKYALGANALHGHRRTNADKRRAVEIAIREFPKVSTAVLASMCGVSRPFVDGLRQQDATVASSPRVGKDGKQYPAKRKAPPKVEKPKPVEKPAAEAPLPIDVPPPAPSRCALTSVSWPRKYGPVAIAQAILAALGDADRARSVGRQLLKLVRKLDNEERARRFRPSTDKGASHATA